MIKSILFYDMGILIIINLCNWVSVVMMWWMQSITNSLSIFNLLFIFTIPLIINTVVWITTVTSRYVSDGIFSKEQIHYSLGYALFILCIYVLVSLFGFPVLFYILSGKWSKTGIEKIRKQYMWTHFLHW